MSNLHANPVFDIGRFKKLFLNEILDWYKRILMATGLLFVIGFMFYNEHVYGRNGDELIPNQIFFYIPFFITCALFTSVIFSEMHHPLGRYHYLTLPCSNLERYLSKYLLTGPVYLVYGLVVFEIFKVVAPAITYGFGGESTGFYNMELPSVPQLILGYFCIHTWFFFGAILFRSYALVKSGLGFLAVYLSLGLVFVISLKIFYFEYFDSLFSLGTNQPIHQGLGFILFRNETVNYVYDVLACLWLIRLSYLSLKDHEA